MANRDSQTKHKHIITTQSTGKSTPSKKDTQSEVRRKISKDLEVIEWSEEDIQRDVGGFCIHEKESDTELKKLKVDFKVFNENVNWHNSVVN